MADFATTVPSGKGPTRRMLQSACNVDNVNNSIRLQSYFNTARQLMLQAEIYRTEQQLETVSLVEFQNQVCAVAKKTSAVLSAIRHHGAWYAAFNFAWLTSDVPAEISVEEDLELQRAMGLRQ